MGTELQTGHGPSAEIPAGPAAVTGSLPRRATATAAETRGGAELLTVETASVATGNPTTALVPVETLAAVESKENIDPEWTKFSPAILRLPVELDVTVPVRDFRVRNLLALEVGQVIESQWGHDDDVPLAAGEVTLAWTEFEVIDSQLAVRITRLS